VSELTSTPEFQVLVLRLAKLHPGVTLTQVVGIFDEIPAQDVEDGLALLTEH